MSAWIKMRTDLRNHPKVVRMASALKADRLRIVGGLWLVWATFDTHSADGFLDGYTPEILDDDLGWKGFSKAMISINWLVQTDEGLEIPEFEEHNGASAKRRAQDTKNKREGRSADKSPKNVRPDVGSVSASDADKTRSRVREEKEEEKEEIQGARPDATTLRALAEGTAEPEDPAISAGTRYGLAARAMRQAGCAATPGDPRLRQLVDQGADIAEFEAVGAEAADKGKGAAWALTALINRRADAAKVRLAPPVTGPAPTVADNPDVAATARRLAAENARAIAKPPASVLALRSRGAATTGEPT